VTTAPFKFDEIGYWSELKLDIVEKYGSAYTKAFANQKRLKKYYIDAFSGAGVHVSKRTKEQIEGSPVRALKVSPAFDRFYFIDMDADKTAYLQKLCEGRSDVYIHTGDSNSYLKRIAADDSISEFQPCFVSARSLWAASRLGGHAASGTVEGG